MSSNILREAFPEIPEEKLTALKSKIDDKCSEYYFLDFLKTAKGNIDDAYHLFIFDERLRCLLLKYILRFEIQIKNSFVEYVTRSTGDICFWNKEKFFIYKTHEEFERLISKIKESFKNLGRTPNSANSYAATYVMSFGTFVSVFKNINPSFKREFIKKYTDYLPLQDFDVLHKYLLCMRALRNRCAHGTHIVSNTLVNQLKQYSMLQNKENINPGMESFSVFELTLYFLILNLNCKAEFIKDLKKLLLKNKGLYSKYGGRQSINPFITQKIFKIY